MVAANNARRAAAALADAALRGGSVDNISVVVVDLRCISITRIIHISKNHNNCYCNLMVMMMMRW